MPTETPAHSRKHAYQLHRSSSLIDAARELHPTTHIIPLYQHHKVKPHQHLPPAPCTDTPFISLYVMAQDLIRQRVRRRRLSAKHCSQVRNTAAKGAQNTAAKCATLQPRVQPYPHLPPARQPWPPFLRVLAHILADQRARRRLRLGIVNGIALWRRPREHHVNEGGGVAGHKQVVVLRIDEALAVAGQGYPRRRGNEGYASLSGRGYKGRGCRACGNAQNVQAAVALMPRGRAWPPLTPLMCSAQRT